jgi:Glycosyltransferase WbsX
MKKYWLLSAGLYALCGLAGCGGGSGTSATAPPSVPPPTPNPVPTITTISPNSASPGDPAFTLSVVGSDFIANSTVEWNSVSLQTTVISSGLMTAQVAADAISTSAPGVVTVVNPGPGGGTSNPLNFGIPCVIPPPTPASTQTKARVGVFYFDGWSGPLTNFHFSGLPLGPYQDREPLSGWQDNSACAMERQLAWAHNFGINFFVFDWYYNAPVNEPSDNLNSAFEITRALPNRHGMQYAIMFVNGPPFDPGASGWTAAVNQWVTYLADPDYVRVNGKPLFVILNVGQMRADFGSAAGVAGALAELRMAAQTQGLPGVYILGDFGPPDGTLGQNSLGDGFSIAGTDGYDAVTIWGYPFATPPVSGATPYSTLASSGHWTWDQAQVSSPIPYVPAAMDGWDPRPWDERSSGGILMWYNRTPQEFAALVSDAIDWAISNPQLRPEPSPTPPLVLITSWNEIGEGNHIVPTVGEGTTYGDALATMLLGP